MQAMVDALILVGVLAVFLLCIRYASWIQKIWITNGRWHTWRFMLMIASLMIVKDIIARVFGEQTVAWLTSQGIGFGVLYAIYVLFVMALGVKLIISAYKTSQTSPKWLGVGIHLLILVGLLSLPFWA